MRKTLAALVALAVAGCTPTPAAPATSSSSPSPSPTPTPTSTPTRDLSNLARREKITLRDEAGDIGTLAYIQGKAAKSPYRDGPLYTAKVKACATERKMTVASFGWLVETADGEQYEAASDQGDGDPKPMYPLFDRSLPKGKCLQGWIVFEISKGAKISHVGYQVSDEQTVFWKV